MKVDKISVSFDPVLGEEIRAAAKRAGGSLSGWLADAAAAKLRSESLKAFLDDYEAEHGAFTEEELAKAARDLGFPVPAETEAAGEAAA